MIVTAGVGLLGIVGVIVGVMLVLRFHASQARAWTRERQELLNRVQRPEVIPQAVPEVWALPDTEPDESNLVGTIAEPSEDD